MIFIKYLRYLLWHKLSHRRVIPGLDLVTILAAPESPISSTAHQLAKAIKYKVKRKIRFPVLSQIMGKENT